MSVFFAAKKATMLGYVSLPYRNYSLLITRSKIQILKTQVEKENPNAEVQKVSRDISRFLLRITLYYYSSSYIVTPCGMRSFYDLSNHIGKTVPKLDKNLYV